MIVLSMAVFLFSASTTRKAQSQGVLVPVDGIIRVQAPQAGVVTQLLVREGQKVRTGDVLFIINSERVNSYSRSIEESISVLLRERRQSYLEEIRQATRQTEQRMAVLRHRLKDINADIDRSTEQINLQERRVDLSEQAAGRFRDLRTRNYISEAQLQERLGELLDQEQRLAELRRTQATSKREQMSTQAELNDLEFQSRRDNEAMKRNAAALSQDLAENEARREALGRATKDGTVTAITGRVGQSVASGAVLATILPEGTDLEAEIYATSHSLGFIRPGMLVQLRYSAYPYQKFGQHLARVREIPSTALRPEELGLSANHAGPPGGALYRIRLRLDKQTVRAYGREIPLKSGMQVDASILLEKRRLYEWVLEPIFTISGRL
jgi:membrane fusion protein